MMLEVRKIGEVKSRFKEPGDPYEMRQYESEIIIETEFVDGLYKIEDYKHLQIIFHFHQSVGYKLIGPRRYGPERGVFASRSPKRPSPIAVTTVELIERKDNVLRVKGLDAIDGTPVLDIKPYSHEIDKNKVERSI